MPNGDVSRPMSSWRGQLTTCNSFPASPETPGEEEGAPAAAVCFPLLLCLLLVLLLRLRV